MLICNGKVIVEQHELVGTLNDHSINIDTNLLDDDVVIIKLVQH